WRMGRRGCGQGRRGVSLLAAGADHAGRQPRRAAAGRPGDGAGRGAVDGEDQGRHTALLRRLTRTVAQRIDMPSVGQTTDELVIVEWLKHEGDTVALGESLFSVQTDKAQVEVESVAAGTLLKVLRDAGDTVQAGSPVAYIGALGEAVPDGGGAGTAGIAI